MKLFWVSIVTKFFYIKEYIRNILIGFSILKRSVKEQNEILSKFVDTLNEFGENSKEVLSFFETYKREKYIIELFEAKLTASKFLANNEPEIEEIEK